MMMMMMKGGRGERLGETSLMQIPAYRSPQSRKWWTDPGLVEDEAGLQTGFYLRPEENLQIHSANQERVLTQEQDDDPDGPTHQHAAPTLMLTLNVWTKQSHDKTSLLCFGVWHTGTWLSRCIQVHLINPEIYIQMVMSNFLVETLKLFLKSWMLKYLVHFFRGRFFNILQNLNQMWFHNILSNRRWSFYCSIYIYSIRIRYQSKGYWLESFCHFWSSSSWWVSTCVSLTETWTDQDSILYTNFYVSARSEMSF